MFINRNIYLGCKFVIEETIVKSQDDFSHEEHEGTQSNTKKDKIVKSKE